MERELGKLLFVVIKLFSCIKPLTFYLPGQYLVTWIVFFAFFRILLFPQLCCSHQRWKRLHCYVCASSYFHQALQVVLVFSSQIHAVTPQLRRNGTKQHISAKYISLFFSLSHGVRFLSPMARLYKETPAK